MLSKQFDRVRLGYARLVLKAILRSKRKGEPVIFAPSLKWEGGMFQRPQQLARALAQQGGLVFYMEPVVDRRCSPFRKVQEGLYVCSITPAGFSSLERPYLHLMTWNWRYWGEFVDPQVIYDIVDALDLFEGDPEEIRAGHAFLLERARLVLATAKSLHQQACRARPDALYTPNGVDTEHFFKAQVVEGDPPGPLAGLVEEGKPLVGYYGALASWFDYSLYTEVARLRTDLSFVLLGKDQDGSLLESGLLDLPNVRWLGMVSYQELPDYLRWFKVATIPFKVNSITHSASPIKLFEYMAGGKPVVATPMEETMKYEGVLAAEGSQAFSSQLDRALELAESPEYRALLERTARQNTWEARARQILARLEADG
jgi:teichuronic acid biosynthesis glycosyltransferase TuaH